MGGIITEREAQTSLKEMNNCKSPGSDGITVEFYKIFWNDLKQYYLDSINYSYAHGSLTELQRQSVITLLPKHNKDTTMLSNWRPISLLNVDYKLASKTIANRIKKHIKSIIHETQTGFIKGRFIGENVRLIFDTIDYLNKTDQDGILIFSDFEKAFDSLSHSFLIKCLKHFNFSTSLIQWIELFYNNITSVIINNGYFSNSFEIERGVRQGCPLSSYLFIICIELLSNAVKHNKDIKGIIINDTEIKQTMFADDATFITDGTEQSFNALIETIDNFGTISGLKLNANKTTVLRVGSLKYTDIVYKKRKKMIWTSESAKALGMLFTNSTKDNIHLNYLNKIKEFYTCLNNWKKRKLSIMGKITVIKTFALPKLVYPFTVLPNPSNEILKEIESEMYKFIWNNKPDKIKRNKLKQSYINGGLKMVDLTSFLRSIKASWVKRLLLNNNISWKSFIGMQLKPYGGNLVFQCTPNKKDVEYICQTNLFLLDVMQAWFDIKQISDKEYFGKSIIWNNQNIKIDKTIVYYKEWHNKGVTFLEHLFDYRTNRFYTFEEFKQLYNISHQDFFKYFQLISHISKTYKQSIIDEGIIYNRDTCLYDIILKSNYVNKFLYNIQLNTNIHKTQIHSSQNKWELIFQKQLNWKTLNIIPFQTTCDNYLRSFQYKIITRIIPTNTLLYKQKLTNSNLCDFCSMHYETIEHLFWECPLVTKLWYEVANYMKQKQLPIQFTLQIILFGLPLNNNQGVCINYIIILVKYFIFSMKYKQKQPIFNHFIRYFEHRLVLEKQIALNNDRIQTFIDTWIIFLEY